MPNVLTTTYRERVRVFSPVAANLTAKNTHQPILDYLLRATRLKPSEQRRDKLNSWMFTGGAKDIE